jgi:hypothetical protein
VLKNEAYISDSARGPNGGQQALPTATVADYRHRVTAVFHVTSSRNRESILTHGLDWSYMGAARGIAGSRQPEQEGCFLALDEREADWFIEMNNTGGAVDVWQVKNVDPEELIESPEGHFFFPGVIRRDQIALVRQDVAERRR